MIKKRVNDMIKAIETYYNGYRFRSRLEARWAIYFDTLGIKYEYEKEGYDLGADGRYLPDFWLVNKKTWLEVKGQEPTAQEILKLESLARQTRCDALLVVGLPERPSYFEETNLYILLHVYMKAYWSKELKVEFDSVAQMIDYENMDTATLWELNDKYIKAMMAARAARFENISKSSPVVTSRVRQPVVMPVVKYTNIKCTWCGSYIPSAESNRTMLMLQFDYTVRTHVRLVNVRIICGKCFIAAHKWSESANAIMSEYNLFWDFTYPKLVNFPIFFGDEYTYAHIPDDEMKYIESIASQLGQELPIRSNELH